MIEGRIDDHLEARITLPILTAGGREEIEFLVDTGFNGFVAIPPSLVQRLQLEVGAVQTGVTADGRTGYFDTVSVEIMWHQTPLSLRAQVLDEPLIGTRLLRGNRLSANWVVDGPFRLSRIPQDDIQQFGCD